MALREEIQELVKVMATIKGFDEFCLEFKDKKHDIVSAFSDWLQKKAPLKDEDNLTLKIVKEKWETIKQVANSNRLFGCIQHLSIKDELLDEFIKDMETCKTGEVAFKKADKQHYKTITEKYAYFATDISSVYHKYQSSQNPYINAHLAQIFNRSGMFDLGLYHLKKTVEYALSYPNQYWETPFAIYGCTEAIWELQYLLGEKGLIFICDQLSLPYLSILEVLFLYLSRSIYINMENPVAATYLSNRANLCYDYQYDFTIIFANNGLIGVNTHIQFMSDKAYAFEIAEKLGLGFIFYDDFKDSLKMYQHDSLIPNMSGGLHDIEDATMGELNKRGWARSIILANKLFDKYKQGNYNLTSQQLDTLFHYLHQVHPNKEIHFKWNKLS